ncbi:MAG: nitroreductase family protein [Candidatus Bathyarchaeia archaeon]|jgi:nitroreductase
MDVFEAIKNRKSVRAYSPKPVPNELLLKIAEAAQLAPSASNIQPWQFIFVTDKDKRNKLSEGRYAGFLAESPVVVVGCGDQKVSPRWYMVDVTIALEHIVLAATSERFGTCWVGSFEQDKVKKLLKIPEDYMVVALLALGYPREQLDQTRKLVHLLHERKKLDQIVSYDEFGKHLG